MPPRYSVMYSNQLESVIVTSYICSTVHKQDKTFNLIIFHLLSRKKTFCTKDITGKTKTSLYYKLKYSGFKMTVHIPFLTFLRSFFTQNIDLFTNLTIFLFTLLS